MNKFCLSGKNNAHLLIFMDGFYKFNTDSFDRLQNMNNFHIT